MAIANKILLACFFVCVAFGLSKHVHAQTPTSGQPSKEVPANNPFVKNGMPCLKEICVGDNLKNVKGIAWMKYGTQTPIDANQLQAILSQELPCDPNATLKNIPGALYYRSESGYPTIARLMAIPVKDEKYMQVVIEELVRIYPASAVTTPAQFEQMDQEFKERYAPIKKDDTVYDLAGC
jgi:hypothetical protein